MKKYFLKAITKNPSSCNLTENQHVAALIGD